MVVDKSTLYAFCYINYTSWKNWILYCADRCIYKRIDKLCFTIH